MPPEPGFDVSTHLAELLRPAAFPHPARDIRLLETHSSWVILAGDFAYKLHKPVKFGSLDFSTREQRAADCTAEITLNRRLCPDLSVYLGVVNLVEQPDGQLAFGAHGRPVEPAVQMRRLPEPGMLPALLARGQADARLMERIAHRLAEFHACASTGPDVDEFGNIEHIRASWLETFSQVNFGALPPERQRALSEYVERFLADNAALFARRVGAGRIRDGHGDLRAASVCLARRRLYLFDCIEFDARLRRADVAAEVAFLAMDLEHHGRADLAWAFVRAYVRSSGDQELLDLLDFYESYRALVRGEVLSLESGEPDPDAAREAAAYLELAYAHAYPLPRPLIIVTMGLPASGKTTLANGLASRLGIPHLSSDVARKQLVGLAPTSHSAEAFGTGMYTRGMTRRTYAILRRHAISWLRRGKSVILDATFGQPNERSAIRQLARRVGAELLFVYCSADEAILQARLAARVGDPSSTSDARPEIWPALRAAFAAPTEVPTTCVDTSQAADVVLQEVLSRVYAHVRTLPDQYAA